jgi:hypothetical protein
MPQEADKRFLEKQCGLSLLKAFAGSFQSPPGCDYLVFPRAIWFYRLFPIILCLRA